MQPQRFLRQLLTQSVLGPPSVGCQPYAAAAGEITPQHVRHKQRSMCCTKQHSQDHNTSTMRLGQLCLRVRSSLFKVACYAVCMLHAGGNRHSNRRMCAGPHLTLPTCIFCHCSCAMHPLSCKFVWLPCPMLTSQTCTSATCAAGEQDKQQVRHAKVCCITKSLIRSDALCAVIEQYPCIHIMLHVCPFVSCTKKRWCVTAAPSNAGAAELVVDAAASRCGWMAHSGSGADLLMLRQGSLSILCLGSWLW